MMTRGGEGVSRVPTVAVMPHVAAADQDDAMEEEEIMWPSMGWSGVMASGVCLGTTAVRQRDRDAETQRQSGREAV